MLSKESKGGAARLQYKMLPLESKDGTVEEVDFDMLSKKSRMTVLIVHSRMLSNT
jgi:hypothetical protein